MKGTRKRLAFSANVISQFQMCFVYYELFCIILCKFISLSFAAFDFRYFVILRVTLTRYVLGFTILYIDTHASHLIGRHSTTDCQHAMSIATVISSAAPLQYSHCQRLHKPPFPASPLLRPTLNSY